MLYSKSNYNTFKKIHDFIQKEQTIAFSLNDKLKSQLVSIVFSNLKKNDNGEIKYLTSRFSDLKNTLNGFFSIDKNNNFVFSPDFLNIVDEHEFLIHCLETKIDYKFLIKFFTQHKYCHLKNLEKTFFIKFGLIKKSPSQLQNFNLLIKTLVKINKIFIIKNVVFSKVYDKNFGNFCENFTIFDISAKQSHKNIYLKEVKDDESLFLNNEIQSHSNHFSYDIVLNKKRITYGITIKSFCAIAHLNSNKEFLNEIHNFKNLDIEEKIYLAFNLNKSFNNILAISNGKKQKINGIKKYLYTNTDYFNFEDIIPIFKKLQEEKQLQWNDTELNITGNTNYEKIIFLEPNRGLKINIPLFIKLLTEHECKPLDYFN